MSDNKLNLLVRFTGVDKLSGGLKNIIGASRASSQSIRGLQDRARELKSELKAVAKDMAGASGSVTNLVNKENRLESQLADVNRQLETQKTRLANIASIEKRFSGIASSAGKAGAAASVAVTAPLVAFGNSAFQAAVDAEEMKSAFNVTFGKDAMLMDAWAGRTANALSRTKVEMMDSARVFGGFFTNADPKQAAAMSQQFAVLAQDLSSFWNVDAQTALDKLRSGLTGEAEPLRDFNVFLNDAAVKAQALKMGLKPVNGELTEQQKIMARAAVIMDQSKKAQGDLIRTSGGTANQLRAAQTAWSNMSLVIGQQLIPALTPAIKTFSGLISSFSQLSPSTQKWIVILGVGAAAFGPILLGVAGIASALATLAPLFVLSGGAAAGAGVAAGGASMGFGALALSMLPIIAVAAVVAGAAYLIYSNWDKISGAFSTGVAAVKGALGSLPAWLGSIGNMAATALLGPFGLIVSLIRSNWTTISGAFAAGVATVKSVFGALPGYLSGIGRMMMNGLLLAINPLALGAKLITMAKTGITAFKNYLGIKSPSRLMMEMGGHISTGLGMGIDRGRGGPVRAMGRMAGAVAGAGALSLSPVSARAPAAAGAAAPAQVVNHFHITQAPGEDAQSLAERVAELVRQAEEKRKRRGFGDDY